MVRGWLRAPVVHFLLLGGLLFALRGLLPAERAERAAVVVSEQRVGQLAADFARQWGVPPDRQQLGALIEEAIDEDLLELEARRLALDLGDQVIHQRLVQKMRAVAADPAQGEAELIRQARELGLDDDLVIRRHLRQTMRLLLARDPAGPPSEADLAAWLERHRDRFLQSAAVSFSQVFVSAAADREGLARRAAAVARRLPPRAPTPGEAAALSDPFPLALEGTARSRGDLARTFGPGFADAVMDLAPASWSSPIPSPFGLHLVWVHERIPERLPPLDQVRRQVAQGLAEERAAVNLSRGLAALRGRYEVRVQWPAEVVARHRPNGSEDGSAP